MLVWVVLGSVFSVLYTVASRCFIPGATTGLAWYFGYFASYGLAAFLTFGMPASKANEVMIVAVKALMPVSGIMLFVYGAFVEYTSAVAPVGDSDILNTASNPWGPVSIIGGIFIIILWLLMRRKG